MADLFAMSAQSPYEFAPLHDHEDAYDNRSHIKDAQRYIDNWPSRAATFADNHVCSTRNNAYGIHDRQRYDIFMPDRRPPKGLIIFVHGGYWMSLSKDHFLHLAKGPLAHGWAVAIVGYRLCPEAYISEITADISKAIQALLSGVAADIDGPVRLVGHSAGGHLVTRMMCDDTPLGPEILSRLDKVISVSGVHDLRPLLTLSRNETLRLSNIEATTESPVCCRPIAGPSLICLVGEDERPEFVRQSAVLPYIWHALGCAATLHIEPAHDHFSIIDTLEHGDTPLTNIVVG
jgi:acetyl esterase/lipase